MIAVFWRCFGLVFIFGGCDFRLGFSLYISPVKQNTTPLALLWLMISVNPERNINILAVVLADD